MAMVADLKWQVPRERWRSLRHQLGRFVRSSPVGAVSAVILILIGAMAIFAAALAPHGPLEQRYAIALPPTGEHPLGTDFVGRDVLRRIIYGARITLVVAIISTVLGDVIGFVWGIVTGYVGGRFDLISQRLLDILLAFPSIILALLLMGGMGAGLKTVIIAIAVTRIPSMTRVIRSVTISVREYAFVEAARASGASPLRILVRHIAPQTVAPMLVMLTLNFGSAVFAESSLSFLGVGVPPPTATWGAMLGGVLTERFQPPWWLMVFPGVMITITILTANLFGDALRDFLDPTMKRQIDAV